MLKLENKILDFLVKNYKTLFLIFVTLLAILIRIKFINFETNDYIEFLKPWFDYFKENGGIKALGHYIGDYAPPYMTIMALLSYLPFKSLISIKVVSIIFDFVLAISSGFLASNLVKKNKNTYFIITYAIVLFIPCVLLNSSLWGQCDSIYASFIILSLLFLMKNRNFISYVFLGLAFSFKLQFIFVLPIYIILYIMNRKHSILYFLIIPLVYSILCLPSIILGKSLTDCFNVYVSQTSTYAQSLVLNFPNIYYIFPGKPDIFYTAGEIIVVMVCALVLFFIIYKKIKFNDEKVLLLTIWFLIMVTYLLPGMHERYLFVGEILTILYFIVYKRQVLIMISVNLISIITYSRYINHMDFPYMKILSIAYLFVIFFYTKNIFRQLSINNTRRSLNEKNI